MDNSNIKSDLYKIANQLKKVVKDHKPAEKDYLIFEKESDSCLRKPFCEGIGESYLLIKR